MWVEVIKDGVKGSPDGCVVKTFKSGDEVPESLRAYFLENGWAEEKEGEPPVSEPEISKIDPENQVTKEEMQAINDKIAELDEVHGNAKKILAAAGLNVRTVNTLFEGKFAPARIDEIVKDFTNLQAGRKASTELLLAFGFQEEAVQQIISGTHNSEDLAAQITDINKKRLEAKTKLEEEANNNTSDGGDTSKTDQPK